MDLCETLGLNGKMTIVLDLLMILIAPYEPDNHWLTQVYNHYSPLPVTFWVDGSA